MNKHRATSSALFRHIPPDSSHTQIHRFRHLSVPEKLANPSATFSVIATEIVIFLYHQFQINVFSQDLIATESVIIGD